MKVQRVWFWMFIGLALMCFASFTHASKTTSDGSVSDPFEGLNRSFWDFNYRVDQSLYLPVTKAYVNYIPNGGREAVNNFVLNFDEPSSAVNHLLMLDVEASLASVVRFAVNSTFGLAGLFDVASYGGLERDRAEFQAVMSQVGIGHGAYLMVPFYGPTTTRELVGDIVDKLYFPYTELSYFEILLRWGADSIYKRAQLLDSDPLIEQALDPYIFVRDAYIQNVNFRVHGEAYVDPIGPALSDEELEEFMNE
ncbi:MlaA family lipoprotein [Motilimonas eburnea]|uniref:MlaA family lipoprotein n=1 Tax=Motilimonas eburnea TaxID=1737488 RepID=UPI001E5813E0|nr:VacJ family lipoprotein [Motilimonas eburnea]MCE2571477.1 VacJ family lipoprotein [Motilimonas eburnea]